MIPDGQYTAVVDRIEDALAVLEVTVGDEQHSLTVDEGALPPDGRHADAILRVTLADGSLVEAAYDPDGTETRRRRAQERFDRLSRRPPRDEDDSSPGP